MNKKEYKLNPYKQVYKKFNDEERLPSFGEKYIVTIAKDSGQ